MADDFIPDSLTRDAQEEYRQWETPGIRLPGTEHKPRKPNIVGLFAQIDAALSAIGMVGGVTIIKTTQALLYADLAHADGIIALVYADTDVTKRDLYVKVGASGTGSWTALGLTLPSQFAADLASIYDVLSQIETAIGDLGTDSLADALAQLEANAATINDAVDDAVDAMNAAASSAATALTAAATPGVGQSPFIGAIGWDRVPEQFWPNGLPRAWFMRTTLEYVSPETQRLDLQETLGRFTGNVNAAFGALLVSQAGHPVLFVRPDQTTGLGPWTERDWHYVVVPDEAGSQVWIGADGTRLYRVSTDEDPGDHYAARIEGGRLSWLYDDGSGRVQVRSVALFASITGIADSVTNLTVVPGIGQSNMQGAANNAVISATTPREGYEFMPRDGVRVLGTQHAPAEYRVRVDDLVFRRWVPAHEIVQPTAGESPMTRIGYQITTTDGDHAALLCNCAVGSVAFDSLVRGTAIYNNALDSVRAARLCGIINDRPLDKVFLAFNQGEGNGGESAAQFQARLEGLQPDWEEDVNKILCTPGVTRPLIIATAMGNNSKYSVDPNVAHGALLAAIANPGQIILAGPGYLYPTGSDGIHKTAQGQADTGDISGTYIHRVDQGVDSLPLYATSAVRTGNEIVVSFHLPFGATEIIRRTDLVTDPGNWGLSFQQSGGAGETITGVAIGPTDSQVTITLSGVPAGTNQKVGIGWLYTPGADGGPTTGGRCQIGTDTAEYACQQLITIT